MWQDEEGSGTPYFQPGGVSSNDLLPILGPRRTGKFGFGLGGESGGELCRRDIADR